MDVRRTIDATTYVALSAALGMIAAVVLIPTLAVGLGLLLFALVGAPLIAAAFAFCHLLARAERRRVRALLGIDFPSRTLPRDGSVPRRAFKWMSSRGAWFELLYGVAALPFVGFVGG
ncbi:MAG TPA: sensor domain-containing protein, partial [Solirubrobacter sp.]|nr:sensor domain-containing protein [Solirubrobacter sp.]